MNTGLVRRAALRLAAGGAALGGVLYVVCLPALGSEGAAHLAAEGVGLAFALTSVYACWCASRVPTPDATAWRVLAIGLASFASCAAIYMATTDLGLSGGWLTLAGMLGLVFRLLAALAMLSFPLVASTARSRWRAYLDLAVVAATVAYLAWALVLSQMFERAAHSPFAARASLFALVDIVLVIIVLMSSLRRPPGLRDASRFVGIGLVFLTLTDWSVGSRVDLAAGSTSLFAATCSFLALGLIATGGWIAAHPTETTARYAMAVIWRDRIPILLAGIAVIVTLAGRWSWSADSVLVVLASIATSTFLTWQFTVLLENEEMVKTLSAQGERFRAMVDTAPIAIVETDPSGIVQVVNPEAARLLDQRPSDLLGQRLGLESTDPATPDDHLRERVLRGETVRDLRVPLRRYDGQTLDMLVSAAPVGGLDGEISGIVWIGSDDGPRLRSLAAMIDVQRMDAYEQMTAGIAHDFNNRLAVVLGTTELLMSQTDDEQDLEMLETIMSAGRRAASLVEQLARATRRHTDDSEWFDLNEVVRSIHTDLGARAPEGVTLRIDLEEQPLVMHADAADVGQAVVNLVLNAFDATKGGSVVTVATCRQTIGDGPHQQVIAELTVTDDGEGIEQAVQGRIFEPFFTTRDGTGRSRGLGLPAVQGVALRSQGDVDVRSWPGQGTVVTMRLPLGTEPLLDQLDGHPRAERPVARRGGGRATILLVDDEPEVRGVASRVLRDEGYTVLEASDAQEALAVIEAGEVDIDMLVSDVAMPGRSGIDLGRDFVALHPGRPVLLISGFVKGSAVTEHAGEIPFPLLTKPIRLGDLRSAVADRLEASS